MCGIVGQVEHRGIVDPGELVAMRDTLEHRGPDDAGSWLSADARVGLGHRRLSFLDLSAAGRQPMPSEDERLWLTLNGEIYNHRELRAELLARGHRGQGLHQLLGDGRVVGVAGEGPVAEHVARLHAF